jgi:ketosteroid isomerase-like protein
MTSPTEVVERFVAAFNAHDLDGFIALLDDDVEMHSLKRIRRGIEEAREWATRAPGGVQQQIVIEELHDAGPNRVLALILRRWHWDEDGELAREEPMAWLFDLHDGKVRRWQPFEDRAEALDAAGLDAAA